MLVLQIYRSFKSWKYCSPHILWGEVTFIKISSVTFCTANYTIKCTTLNKRTLTFLNTFIISHRRVSGNTKIKFHGFCSGSTLPEIAVASPKHDNTRNTRGRMLKLSTNFWTRIVVNHVFNINVVFSSRVLCSWHNLTSGSLQSQPCVRINVYSLLIWIRTIITKLVQNSLHTLCVKLPCQLLACGNALKNWRGKYTELLCQIYWCGDRMILQHSGN